MCGGGAPKKTTTTQVQELPDEARPFLYGGDGRAGLLPQAYDLAQQPMQLPDYMLAGRTPTQVAAETMAREGRGSYLPYLQSAQGLTGQGVMATEQAGRLAQQQLGAAQAERQRALNALDFALRGTAEAGRTGADLSEAEQATRDATARGIFATEQAGRLSGQATGRGVRELGAASRMSGQATGRGVRELGAASRMSGQATGVGMRGLEESYGLGREVPAAALTAAERGIAGFAGTGAEYDPGQVAAYMNPYEQQVIDAALSDIARSGEMQLNEARAGAVNAGAFGGARSGLVEAEIGRNILSQQAQTAANLRQQGFESAAGRSQAAFEAARERQQAAASNIGQLGLSGVGQAASGIGQLANISSAAGQLGQAGAGQRADIGATAAQLGQAGAAQRAGFGTSAAQLGQAGAGQLAGFGTSAAQLGQAGAGQLADMRTTGSRTALAAAGQAGNIGSSLGQLGLSYGQLGQQTAGQLAQFGQGLGSLGAQTAGFGQQQQAQQLQDINTALTIGGQQQAQQQAQLDAARQNQYQQAMAPYQSLGFFSDIFQGAPTGTSSVMQQQTPGASPFSQVAGLGIGAYGLANSGLFGGGQ